jgi:hypothetical protein
MHFVTCGGLLKHTGRRGPDKEEIHGYGSLDEYPAAISGFVQRAKP